MLRTGAHVTLQMENASGGVGSSYCSSCGEYCTYGSNTKDRNSFPSCLCLSFISLLVYFHKHL